MNEAREDSSPSLSAKIGEAGILRPRISQPSQLDIAALTQKVEACTGIADLYARLTSLDSLYREELVPFWNVFIKSTDAYASALIEARKSGEQSIRSQSSIARAELEHQKRAEIDIPAQLAESVKADASRFRDESNTFVLEFCKRIGDEIKGAKPPDEIAARKASMRNAFIGNVFGTYVVGAPASENYRAARRAADVLPGAERMGDVAQRFKPKLEDVLGNIWLVLKAVPLASQIFVGAVVTLVAHAFTQSYLVGLFFGVWAAVGVFIIQKRQRANVPQVYQTLIEQTAREQCLREASAANEIQRLEEQIASGKARCETRERAIESETQDANRQLESEWRAAIATATQTYWTSREACSKASAGLSALLDAAIIARRDVYARLQSSRCEDDLQEAPLAERTRFRMGARVEATHNGPSGETERLLMLGAGSFTPVICPSNAPVCWEFDRRKSLLLHSDNPSGASANSFPGAIITRILHQVPAGKANFMFFDPIGLGRNFGAFLKLGDYSDKLISGKVWSDREHVRSKLKDLIAHIENVTQKYLRSDFADIDAYNEKAGEIAEPYRILVLADFPEAFDEESTRDLVRVIQNGPRCGVFSLIHINTSRPLPHGFSLDMISPHCMELSADKGSMRVRLADGACLADQRTQDAIALELDASADGKLIDEIVVRFGEGAQLASRVEVPYQRLLTMAKIGEDEWWSQSSNNGIEVPLGPSGAKNVQTLRLGSGLAHHVLIVGRPGSGKSNLIHVCITTLARRYAPDEVQLYLVDFKKGVEFKCYADSKLPHARVIAVESEREFGLSVLEGLDAELKTRGELFRSSGSVNLSEYRNKSGQKLPRIILIVDEFQEFFTRDDRIKRESLILFDRLVRQGRAFGIHIILGTQSLANSGLERSTQDQMAVRIALQCSEADSRLILAQDNVAARLLSRPGEGIYNDSAGLVEGNNLFQAALFSEDDRLRELAALTKAAEERSWHGPPPTIFEGHEAAQIAACPFISTAIVADRPNTPRPLWLWLGEPISLKSSVALPLKRQSGKNLLVLSKDEEQGVGVVMAALLSVAAQTDRSDCRFSVIDLTSADAVWAEHPEEFAASMPHKAEVLGRRDLRLVLPELEAEVTRRGSSGLMREPTIILTVLGLHRARELREGGSGGSSLLSMNSGDDATPNLSNCMLKILREGPEVGVHTFFWCDTYGNLDRALDRGGLNEIGLKVSGPLAGQESHRIFDDEVAAGIDKPFRMVKYDDDQVGAFELFRPYAVPPVEYIREVGKQLSARA